MALLIVMFSVLSGIIIGSTKSDFYGIVLVIILSIIMVFPLVSKMQENLFEPITFVLIPYFGYISSSLYAILARNGTILGFSTPNDKATMYLNLALVYSILGLLSFYIGYFWKKKKTSSIKSAQANYEAYNNSKYIKEYAKIKWILWGASILGLLGYLVFIQSVGGLEVYWQFINRRSAVGGTRYFLALTQFLPITGLIFLAYSLKLRRNPIWAYLYLFVTTLILLSLGARLPMVLVWSSVLIIWWFTGKQKRIPVTRFLILVILAIIIMIGMRSYRFISIDLRHTNISEIYDELNQYYTPQKIIENTVATRDFTDINIFAHIIAVAPSQIDYQLGKSFISLPLYAVPRTIWPDKPPRLDVYIYNQLFEISNTTAIPPGIITELYLNFHILGIILGMFIFGWSAAWVYHVLINSLNKGSIMGLVLYALLCVYYLMYITRTSFDRGATNILIIVGLWSFFAFTTRAKFRPRDQH